MGGGRAAGAARRAARRPCVRAGDPAPELAAPPTPRRSTATDADARRLRFFDAVAALFAAMAGTAPAIVVFDDLHWAGRPTLQLLRHLVRSPLPARTLFVGTYRETELAGGHPLQELVGDLRREGTSSASSSKGWGGRRRPADRRAGRRVALAGLRRRAPWRDRGQPVLHRGGRRAPARRGRAGRAGVTLAEAGVPEGVREVTSRRLRRLGDDARQAVVAGAVIGASSTSSCSSARSATHCPATRWSPRWRRRCRRG